MTLNLPAIEDVLEAYQQRLDEALDAGASQYDAAFEASPPGVGVHEIDSSMVVRRVSTSELSLLGYTREEMVGRPVVEFIVMDETSRRAIQRKLSGAATLRPFARAFRRGDGQAVTMLLLDRYLRDEAGSIVGIRSAMTPLDAAQT